MREDVQIALGPAGALGLIAVGAAVVRRSRKLAAVGAVAVAADLTLPQLRGFAKVRATSSARPDVAEPSRSVHTAATPSAA